jgi:hypothetical protein
LVQSSRFKVQGLVQNFGAFNFELSTLNIELPIPGA